MTTIRVDLEDEEARRLADAAARNGLAEDEWLRLLIHGELKRPIQMQDRQNTKRCGQETIDAARQRPIGSNPAPTDAELKQWLHDRRARKGG